MEQLDIPGPGLGQWGRTGMSPVAQGFVSYKKGSCWELDP